MYSKGFDQKCEITAFFEENVFSSLKMYLRRSWSKDEDGEVRP